MIYLDNAATSFPKPPGVLDALRHFAEETAANPGRSGHRMAVEAEKVIERARAQLARLLNAPDASRIAFTLNATDALNIALKGYLTPGDHVVTTSFEHNSINRPLGRMEKEGRATVTRVGPRDDLTLDPDAVRRACTSKTRLVAVTGCSNVFGAMNDLAGLARAAHDAGARILVDASQAVGVGDIDVRAMNLDMAAFPGHKGLYGPMGTGALYVAPDLNLAPWREGGTGTHPDIELHPTAMPHALEGGTPNAHGIAGLAAGVEFLLATDIRKIREHERALARAFVEQVAGTPDVSVLNRRNAEASTGIVALSFRSASAAEVASILDERYEIAARAGLHCAPGAHRALGTFPDGALRLSFGYFNTKRDVEAAARAISEVSHAFAA